LISNEYIKLRGILQGYPNPYIEPKQLHPCQILTDPYKELIAGKPRLYNSKGRSKGVLTKLKNSRTIYHQTFLGNLGRGK